MEKRVFQYKIGSIFRVTKSIEICIPTKWGDITDNWIFLNVHPFRTGDLSEIQAVSIFCETPETIVSLLSVQDINYIIERIQFLKRNGSSDRVYIPILNGYNCDLSDLKTLPFGKILLCDILYNQYQASGKVSDLNLLIAAIYSEFTGYALSKLRYLALKLDSKSFDLEKQAALINFEMLMLYIRRSYPYIFKNLDKTKRESKTSHLYEAWYIILNRDPDIFRTTSRKPTSCVISYMNYYDKLKSQGKSHNEVINLFSLSIPSSH
jgi:hypothetical protein